MLVVAAMGASLGSFTARLSALPGFARAAQFFQARCGFSFGAVAAGRVQAVTISASGAVVALAPGAVWATTTAMVGHGGDGTAPPAPVGFKSHEAFKKAMGSAGPGKEWHHVVEQNPANEAKFSPERLHSTENEIAIERDLHIKINRLYSSKRFDITETTTMTVREWLSTQSYEAQRSFGLRILKIVLAGGVP